MTAAIGPHPGGSRHQPRRRAGHSPSRWPEPGRPRSRSRCCATGRGQAGRPPAPRPCPVASPTATPWEPVDCSASTWSAGSPTELAEARQRGMPIIGICNGFQALVRAGLLPGPLDPPGTGPDRPRPWPPTPTAASSAAGSTLVTAGPARCRPGLDGVEWPDPVPRGPRRGSLPGRPTSTPSSRPDRIAFRYTDRRRATGQRGLPGQPQRVAGRRGRHRRRDRPGPRPDAPPRGPRPGPPGPGSGAGCPGGGPASTLFRARACEAVS